MKKLVNKYWYHLIFYLGIPSFFAGFSALYNTLGIREALTYGGYTFEFHLAMLFCIAIVVMAITRTVFWAITIKNPAKWWGHMLWCMGETYAVVYFFALYLCLFSGEPYFECVLNSMGYTFLCFIYPYTILILAQIASENRDAAKIAAMPAEQEDLSQRIRFYDDRHKLKLTLDRSAVLKIQADYNYVQIYYLERDAVQTASIRSSMKSIEEAASKHGLVRCHRSFFINPDHVSILSRDRDGGINATLDRSDTEPVPVSKKYYDSLSEIL